MIVSQKFGKNSSDEKDLNDVPDDDEYDTRHDGFFVNREKLERAGLNDPNIIGIHRNTSHLSHVPGCEVNKEEDDKMRTTAANVAARADVGGCYCRNVKVRLTWHLLLSQALGFEGISFDNNISILVILSRSGSSGLEIHDSRKLKEVVEDVTSV
ncbi:hypothetical protein Tco_0941445 [Tanacetum coccineum]|uniref:Uncharacterized protein n=1 Tax=Tanacetum coccineum TaxID=301880 RepID=A0ABQ5DQV8_9ASTR